MIRGDTEWKMIDDIYADGTVRCSGEYVNGDVLCAENGPRDYEFPERSKGIGGLLK